MYITSRISVSRIYRKIHRFHSFCNEWISMKLIVLHSLKHLFYYITHGLGIVSPFCDCTGAKCRKIGYFNFIQGSKPGIKEFLIFSSHISSRTVNLLKSQCSLSDIRHKYFILLVLFVRNLKQKTEFHKYSRFVLFNFILRSGFL